MSDEQDPAKEHGWPWSGWPWMPEQAEPAPATSGEWTAQKITEMGGTNDWQVANEIATAHNADLAAEREASKKLH